MERMAVSLYLLGSSKQRIYTQEDAQVMTVKKITLRYTNTYTGQLDTVKFDKLVIDDCDCGIFTAKLYFSSNGKETIIDCRPSDGVVLALDRSIPIYVAKVLTCPE